MAAAHPGLAETTNGPPPDAMSTTPAGRLARSSRLLSLIAGSLRHAAELYPRGQSRCLTPTVTSPPSYRAILDAVLAHDACKATAALATHIQNTTDVLLDEASTQPDDAVTA